MKILLISLFVLSSLSSFAGNNQPAFSKKTKDIIKAINVGSYSTENEYVEMLKTSCERNKCTSLESIKIKEAGKHIVLCNTNYLKANDLVNSDANNICGTKQPIYGCDSNITPLLRKMCYSANNYSLGLWKKRERKLKNRFPASK